MRRKTFDLLAVVGGLVLAVVLAVAGGLLMATFATLFFVPVVFELVHGRHRRAAAPMSAER